MKFHLYLFFLSLLFFVSPKISFAAGDTIPGDTTTKYELWDPRNPDCPCHQYQKLADEEFKKLQDQKRKDSLNTIGQFQHTTADSTVAANTTSSAGNSGKHAVYSKSKLKHVSKEIRKSKLLHVRKSSGKKWKKGHLIDCGKF